MFKFTKTYPVYLKTTHQRCFTKGVKFANDMHSTPTAGSIEG